MGELVRFELGAGGDVLVEVADDAYGVARVARDHDPIAIAAQKLESALALVRPTARALLESLNGLDLQERQIEFGVSLNGEAGAFIARTGAEAHFQITLISRVTPAVEAPSHGSPTA